jgi:hypothetical protein
MTQADADQLAEWIDGLSAAELNLLWRWVTLAWVNKVEKEMHDGATIR